ncbi:MAG: hypothetical protein HY791_22290 [Deltaproteobacteria bacterium]|nr:hypothetical protein [Deltaproteobacteria bacterium]
MLEQPSLPGRALVERGLADLAAGTHSAEALVCSMAASRLRAVGFDIEPSRVAPDPELRLLESVGGELDRYNALRRELISFLDAADALGWRRVPDRAG